MSAKKRTARASEPLAISRRAFLGGGLVALASLALPSKGLALRDERKRRVPRSEPQASEEMRAPAAPSADVVALLEKSGFVYVSPLLRSGAESRCHGEVWYGWLDGGVVVITAKDTWKARALARGLERARIWVGDHGRVGGVFGGREDFRKAPSFEAHARQEKAPAVLDQLMALYRKKYPDEIGRWEERMRAGFQSGERILIRYVPA